MAETSPMARNVAITLVVVGVFIMGTCASVVVVVGVLVQNFIEEQEAEAARAEEARLQAEQLREEAERQRLAELQRARAEAAARTRATLEELRKRREADAARMRNSFPPSRTQRSTTSRGQTRQTSQTTPARKYGSHGSTDYFRATGLLGNSNLMMREIALDLLENGDITPGDPYRLSDALAKGMPHMDAKEFNRVCAACEKHIHNQAMGDALHTYLQRADADPDVAMAAIAKLVEYRDARLGVAIAKWGGKLERCSTRLIPVDHPQAQAMYLDVLESDSPTMRVQALMKLRDVGDASTLDTLRAHAETETHKGASYWAKKAVEAIEKRAEIDAIVVP